MMWRSWVLGLEAWELGVGILARARARARDRVRNRINP